MVGAVTAPMRNVAGAVGGEQRVPNYKFVPKAREGKFPLAVMAKEY